MEAIFRSRIKKHLSGELLLLQTGSSGSASGHFAWLPGLSEGEGRSAEHLHPLFTKNNFASHKLLDC